MKKTSMVTDKMLQAGLVAACGVAGAQLADQDERDSIQAAIEAALKAGMEPGGVRLLVEMAEPVDPDETTQHLWSAIWADTVAYSKRGLTLESRSFVADVKVVTEIWS